MPDDKQTGNIIFYCKDCEEVVDTVRCGKKYVYKCKKCGTKNVAFGTKKSIYGFFRLDDKEESDASKKEKGSDAPPGEDEKVMLGSVG